MNLEQVTATSPTGEISRQDVERFAAARLARNGAVTSPSCPLRSAEVLPLTGMRRTIARRMHDSLHEMAQLTLTRSVPVKRLAKLRRQLKRDWARDERVVPTTTDLVGRAAVLAILATIPP